MEESTGQNPVFSQINFGGGFQPAFRSYAGSQRYASATQIGLFHTYSLTTIRVVLSVFLPFPDPHCRRRTGRFSYGVDRYRRRVRSRWQHLGVSYPPRRPNRGGRNQRGRRHFGGGRPLALVEKTTAPVQARLIKISVLCGRYSPVVVEAMLDIQYSIFNIHQRKLPLLDSGLPPISSPRMISDRIASFAPRIRDGCLG